MMKSKPAVVAVSLLIGIGVAAIPLAGAARSPVDSSSAAPVLGGWRPVARADANAQVRKAAMAAVARIPTRKPRLAKVESAQSQVVAGTNYQLVMRLKDGTRWSARVWHKLDGGYEVSDVAQVR